MIDFKKYKRFFTFGCSFTSYLWPTWADIVSKEMPQAEFYNFGKSGAGNLLISSRIAEANNRFKFTDTDLVMVMFTSYCREDRWVEGTWLAKGDVFSNKVHSKEWLMKFADERGYMIRDAALIDLSVRYLESTPATVIPMLSLPFVTSADSPNSDSKVPNDIRDVYASTFDKFKPSLFELQLFGWDTDYKKFHDGHPSPIKYFNYLTDIGINLSEETKQYALDATQILIEESSRELVQSRFPEQYHNEIKNSKLVF